jgi:hypothetical protein
LFYGKHSAFFGEKIGGGLAEACFNEEFHESLGLSS